MYRLCWCLEVIGQLLLLYYIFTPSYLPSHKGLTYLDLTATGVNNLAFLRFLRRIGWLSLRNCVNIENNVENRNALLERNGYRHFDYLALPTTFAPTLDTLKQMSFQMMRIRGIMFPDQWAISADSSVHVLRDYVSKNANLHQLRLTVAPALLSPESWQILCKSVAIVMQRDLMKNSTKTHPSVGISITSIVTKSHIDILKNETRGLFETLQFYQCNIDRESLLSILSPLTRECVLFACSELTLEDVRKLVFQFPKVAFKVKNCAQIPIAKTNAFVTRIKWVAAAKSALII